MIKIETLNNYNYIENNDVKIKKNDVAEEKIALIKQENLGNLEKPKSKSLWEKFKKLCCICKIIELWKKLFNSPKYVKPTNKLNNIQVLEPQIYEVKEKVEKVVEIAPKVKENEKEPDIIVQIPQVIPPVIPQDNETIVKTPLKVQEIKLPKQPKDIKPIFEKAIEAPKTFEFFPKDLQPNSKNVDDRIGKKIDEVDTSAQLDYENKDFIINELLTEPADEEHIVEAEPKIVEAGPRTVEMKQFLSNFPAYDQNQNLIELNHKKYVPITGALRDISTKAVASCGSSSKREILVLDPDNSPKLKKHYAELKEILINFQKNQGKALFEEEVLKQVRDYVRHHIFLTRNIPDLSEKIDGFVELKHKSKQTPKAVYEVSKNYVADVPIISIDEFIKEEIGICRHHALVTGYLLDRLTKEPEPRMLEGIVQCMRDNIVHNGERAAHTWIAFLSTKEKKRWHIDTLWGELIDFSTQQGIEHLKLRGYGENAINNQIKKAQIVPI